MTRRILQKRPRLLRECGVIVTGSNYQSTKLCRQDNGWTAKKRGAGMNGMNKEKEKVYAVKIINNWAQRFS